MRSISNDTEISKYICSLKRKNIDFKTTWEVIKRTQPITNGNNQVCRSCIKELPLFFYALKEKKMLEQKEPIYAYLYAYQKKIVTKVQ